MPETARNYGQYCGVAKAIELIGERWAPLVIRDLLLRPKRFTELRVGLPKIPSNILTARLKELENAGVLQRRVLPRPASAVVYELTPYGRELEPILHALGGWGLKSLHEPRPGDIINADSLALALHGSFQASAAKQNPGRYELHVLDSVVHAYVERGALEVGFGPAQDPDLTLETDLAIRALLAGEIAPQAAAREGRLRLTGKRSLLKPFFQVFRLPSSAHPAT